MKYYELDKEEKKILKEFEGGKLKTISKAQFKKEKAKFEKIADNTLKKSKNINIRLSEKDLQKVKSKAIKKGIPYQTLIASIIHQYTDNENSINI